MSCTFLGVGLFRVTKRLAWCSLVVAFYVSTQVGLANAWHDVVPWRSYHMNSSGYRNTKSLQACSFDWESFFPAPTLRHWRNKINQAFPLCFAHCKRLWQWTVGKERGRLYCKCTWQCHFWGVKLVHLGMWTYDSHNDGLHELLRLHPFEIASVHQDSYHSVEYAT